MDLPGVHLQGDMVVGHHPGEGLDDVLKEEHGGGGRIPREVPLVCTDHGINIVWGGAKAIKLSYSQPRAIMLVKCA
jgi:hypothetical protein